MRPLLVSTTSALAGSSGRQSGSARAAPRQAAAATAASPTIHRDIRPTSALPPDGRGTALIHGTEAERGRLDILVNDVWGGDPMIDWSAKFWQLDIAKVRALVEQAVLSHLITARHAAPLMVRQGEGLIVEITDGHHDG